MAAQSPFKQLRTSFIKDQFGGTFIPLDKLNQTITADVISGHLLSRDYETFDPELLKKIVERAGKVFAILILTEKENQIEALFTENLTDEDLPLLPTEGDDDNILESGHTRGKYFHAFDSWTDARVSDFLDKQWYVQAPVLGATDEHMILGKKCPMPFIERETIRHVPGTVIYRSTLHSAHHEGPQATGKDCKIAIKEFLYKNPFDKEKENLEKMKNLRHQHLIQHIASYEKENQYYVIFPWANGGDLRNFWDQTKPNMRTQKLTLWSLQQMLGLASALEALHQLNCRHGDLKPENILHFKEGQEEGTLKIADLGVSKVHEKGTALRVDGTFERATTPSYEPPEVILIQDTPRSRKYDMWSMGCILLEFVIWLLTDYELIEAFNLARAGSVAGSALEAHFYKIVNGQPEIHPIVLEVIEGLRKHPRYVGTALEALVELICGHLLLVKVEPRYTAEELRKELEEIFFDAKNDPSYLFDDVNSPRSWLKDISWAPKEVSQKQTQSRTRSPAILES
jgi:serine/threonine protein kinase